MYLHLFLPVLALAFAAPLEDRAAVPTVTIASPAATVIGSSSGGVDSFSGIPFAQPPTGSLRLKPPASLASALGTVTATAAAASCPQFYFDTDFSQFPTNLVGELLDLPFFQKVTNAQEDCLTININRPSGTTSSSKLPVLVYIFGGGFQLGSTGMYGGSGWVSSSVASDKPVIYAAMNYRVGGFGFMPGSEILQDGSANIGLLDQRLALQWIADNIEAFGGDPSKVTIWGESAGAISVFNQIALFDSDYTYKGQPLFRAGIMDSGSIVPAKPIDGTKGQAVYDQVVSTAGCSSSSDTLDCLRALPYEDFLNAANSVPGLFSYSSLDLSYLPRPDGTVLSESPDLLVQQGKYAKIPFIIGDQEDEGTIFALLQGNISTTQQLHNYLRTYFFPEASEDSLNALLMAYPDDPTQGSPFGTGILNILYPQYKRLAAIFGDITFTLTRRAFLNVSSTVYPDVPSWSYLASYDYGTPYIGTCHGSDILQVFNDILPNYAGSSFRSYYLSFVYNLDPNTASGYTNWPQWSTSNQLIQMNATQSGLIVDNFREDAYQVLLEYESEFYV